MSDFFPVTGEQELPLLAGQLFLLKLADDTADEIIGLYFGFLQYRQLISGPLKLGLRASDLGNSFYQLSSGSCQLSIGIQNSLPPIKQMQHQMKDIQNESSEPQRQRP